MIKEQKEQLRAKFMEECTISYAGLRRVDMTPQNIFEWFIKELVPKQFCKSCAEELGTDAEFDLCKDCMDEIKITV